ncbi:class I adenylate-forming enzyme family protein [Pseudonocardia oroxyli]|uniref:Long-chain acyl-CoA synthetase n=1 Tax=Pseudonocardia oroxyli TaxID=366584 RepID=A0A1G8D0B6_PSEOR|nr:class I adenylate-forming enzyme family protein [Pseudonocardia oroxyli]SDH51307.1 long-chain acyl-CoA synthetase [Pseudonocardia oroxyli]
MTATEATGVAERRWGREVERATVHGHSCLVYRQRPRSVGELLLERRRWGDRELFVQGERRFTGPDNEHAVARVAGLLRDRGLKSGDTVFLSGFNSIDWLVTFWAVQSIGAVAALGNAWWSDAEVAAIVAALEPTLAVTDRELPSVPTVGFGEVRAVVDRPEPAELVLARPVEDAPALVMFSSGTTGIPKGVLMSHRSVVANIQNVLTLTGRLPDELSEDHPGTVGLLTAPLFHLAGIQVSITTMISGGRIALLRGKFDPAEVLEMIQTERVRVWGAIPTMVSRVLDHPGFDGYDTSSVSSVPMGGAAISPQLRERVGSRFSGVRSRVGSLYGLTEAGGILAAGSGRELSARPGAVGRALPVVELRIDGAGPDGSGEIRARTPAMTDGYLGDPTPLTDADGWISTGDLGRLDDEGWLYVTGRSKDIIIRGGENIAAVHVEEGVASHPDVAEVAVVPLPDPDLGEVVAAAVVLQPGASATERDLAEHAARTLARHEVPSRWWFTVGPLPTNASGKVLRRAVREQWPTDTEGDV